MDDMDRRYVRARLERERDMARRARDSRAAARHRELARLYEGMLEGVTPDRPYGAAPAPEAGAGALAG